MKGFGSFWFKDVEFILWVLDDLFKSRLYLKDIKDWGFCNISDEY